MWKNLKNCKKSFKKKKTRKKKFTEKREKKC